jgi:hypothetical protein
VQAEMMEAALVDGKPVDIGEYATLVSTLTRVATRIGINRIARNITPTLKDYVEHRRAEAEAEEDD